MISCLYLYDNDAFFCFFCYEFLFIYNDQYILRYFFYLVFLCLGWHNWFYASLLYYDRDIVFLFLSFFV